MLEDVLMVIPKPFDPDDVFWIRSNHGFGPLGFSFRLVNSWGQWANHTMVRRDDVTPWGHAVTWEGTRNVR